MKSQVTKKTSSIKQSDSMCPLKKNYMHMKKILLIAIIGMFVLTSCGQSNYLGCPAYSSNQTMITKHGKKAQNRYVKHNKPKKSRVW